MALVQPGCLSTPLEAKSYHNEPQHTSAKAAQATGGYSRDLS